MKASDIEAIYKRAVRVGKTAKYVIRFDDIGLTLEGTIVRE